jgi:hypothetical protein
MAAAAEMRSIVCESTYAFSFLATTSGATLDVAEKLNGLRARRTKEGRWRENAG